MQTIDRGEGSPILLIPGIQGRCEWMEPAIAALAKRHRVLSFSLGTVETFDDWTSRIERVLDRAGEPAAIVAGVSFGGLIAARFAARHPDRVRSLVLASAPSPRWRLDRWSARYVAHPWLALPLFSVRGCVRLVPEILSARPSWPQRVRLAAGYGVRVVRAPVSPSRMARCVKAWQATDLVRDCAAITAPTLILTGEPDLDRVVPVASSLEYLDLIPGARHVVLPRTGHIGVITTPGRFADEVDAFVASTQLEEPAVMPNSCRTRYAS